MDLLLDRLRTLLIFTFLAGFSFIEIGVSERERDDLENSRYCLKKNKRGEFRPHVYLLKTTKNGQKRIACFYLERKTMKFKRLVKDKTVDSFKGVLVQGISGKNGKKLSTRSGYRFLEELKYHFDGSYYRASRIYNLPAKKKN